MNVVNKGRASVFSGLICTALLTLSASAMTSGCATNNHEGARYSPSNVAGDANTTHVSAAELAILYDAQARDARWVDADPETMYPDRYRTRVAHGKTSDSSSSQERSADNRDPRGWTRRELIKKWGIPAKIEGQRWIYRVPNEKCKGEANTKKIEFNKDKVKSVRIDRSSHC